MPYYYTDDGMTEAYIHIGIKSAVAATKLKRFVMRGRNALYDSLMSPYNYEDFFLEFRECYKSWTENGMTEKSIESFGIRDTQGYLTYVGALLTDDSPIHWFRPFCIR